MSSGESLHAVEAEDGANGDLIIRQLMAELRRVNIESAAKDRQIEASDARTAELIAIAAAKEHERIVAQLKDAQEKQRIEQKILVDGLPKLGGKGPHASTTTSKAHVTKRHKMATAIEKPFNLFHESNKRTTPWINSIGQSSYMWRSFPHGGFGWNHEYDIKRHVINVFSDLIAYGGLIGEVQASEEVSIFSIDNEDEKGKSKNERSDIWLTALKTRVPSEFPIGVGEVKQPSKAGTLSALAGNNSPLFGQIYDYLMGASTFCGLRWSFGIVTTYDEWRICWLPNADEAAAETEFDRFVNISPKALEYASDGVSIERRIHVSRIYKYNEPALIEALIHLLHKMHTTPQEQFPIPLISKDRKYPMLAENGWIWQKFAPDTLSYTPHGGAKNYFLLQNYHGGGDGLVWLAASEKGKLAVLKFPKYTSAVGNEKDVLDSLELE
jgi:hypothetical protein